MVKKFVKEHIKGEQQKATIRFETSPGLQAQVDWEEEVKFVSKSGEVFVFNIFLMVLGYSRIKYLEVTEDRAQKTLATCFCQFW